MKKSTKGKSSKLNNSEIKSENFESPVKSGYKWMGEYTNCFTFKVHPISEQFIDKFSCDLVNWAKNNEDAFKISEFFLNFGIAPTTFRLWRESYPKIKMASEVAMTLIGNRREKGGLKRQFDSAMIRFTMPLYDDEWKELLKLQNDCKTPEVSQVPIVVIEQFPESNLVPRKTPEEIAARIHAKISHTQGLRED